MSALELGFCALWFITVIVIAVALLIEKELRSGLARGLGW
jgi:hypothetical protein